MNKRYIKIGIFFLIATILCVVVYFSKQYFDTNYNTHQTVESNLNLYRIKMQQQEEEKAQEQEPRLVQEAQAEVHSQKTQVIDESDVQSKATPEPAKSDATKDIKQTDKQDARSIKQDVKSVEQKTEDKVKSTEKPLEQKPVKKEETITKPKTLEQKPTVTESVLKNPAFQSYVIQVGAFSTKEEAEVMKKRVEKIPSVKKFRVENKFFPEKNLHKVLVEYFESADDARQVCAELKKENVQCFATKI